MRQSLGLGTLNQGSWRLRMELSKSNRDFLKLWGLRMRAMLHNSIHCCRCFTAERFLSQTRYCFCFVLFFCSGSLVMSHCANKLWFDTEVREQWSVSKFLCLEESVFHPLALLMWRLLVQNEWIRGSVRGQEFTCQSLCSSHKIFNSPSSRQH